MLDPDGFVYGGFFAESFKITQDFQWACENLALLESHFGILKQDMCSFRVMGDVYILRLLPKGELQ